MNERDLFDESVLRRALRLEEDERAPRVLLTELVPARPVRDDLAARLVAGACLALAGLVAAAVLRGAAVDATVLAPALAADLFDRAIGLAVPLADAFALLALFVAPLTSPLTLVATVAAMVLYVRFTERGADHVHTS